MIAAAVKGDNAEVARLLADGVNVNAKDNEGGTALAHAAWFGHLGTVKLLLEKGADVHAKKNDGATPLSLATWNKHADVVEALTKADSELLSIEKFRLVAHERLAQVFERLGKPLRALLPR